MAPLTLRNPRFAHTKLRHKIRFSSSNHAVPNQMFYEGGKFFAYRKRLHAYIVRGKHREQKLRINQYLTSHEKSPTWQNAYLDSYSSFLHTSPPKRNWDFLLSKGIDGFAKMGAENSLQKSNEWCSKPSVSKPSSWLRPKRMRGDARNP